MLSILRGIHNKNLSLKIQEAGGKSSSLFWRSINNKRADSIITQDISDKDIDRAIKKCKNGKSTGFDMIPNEFIINMSVNAKEVLKQLFNVTLCNGNIPQ